MLLGVPESLESPHGDREHNFQGQKMQEVGAKGGQIKGFKGAEGNEGDNRSGSNGKRKVLGEPVWGDLQFLKEGTKYHTILSKTMPTRKQS